MREANTYGLNSKQKCRWINSDAGERPPLGVGRQVTKYAQHKVRYLPKKVPQEETSRNLYFKLVKRDLCPLFQSKMVCWRYSRREAEVPKWSIMERDKHPKVTSVEPHMSCDIRRIAKQFAEDWGSCEGPARR